MDIINESEIEIRTESQKENSISLRIGDVIRTDLNSNDYLSELYSKLLKCYSMLCVNAKEIMQDVQAEFEPYEIKDLVRFAELLAKVDPRGINDYNKEMAQEILISLRRIYPDNLAVLAALDSVLTVSGNYVGKKQLQYSFSSSDLVGKIVEYRDKQYLRLNDSEEIFLLPPQKEIFSHLSDSVYSFSGPTSLGKTFLFINYIKKQLVENPEELKNFYILLPSRALISEVKSELIIQFGELLNNTGYIVSTSADDLNDKRIFVLTPERFLWHLEKKQTFEKGCLFIDEAQMISSKSHRSLLYYKAVDRASRMEPKWSLIFASPNIPNPDIFGTLIPKSRLSVLTGSSDLKECSYSAEYSPVSHFVLLADFREKTISVLNKRSKSFDYICELEDTIYPMISISTLVHKIGKDSRNVVYCNAKESAISWAREYSEKFASVENMGEECVAALNSAADKISEKIHEDCYLVEMLRKGVAYHVGYLPPSIRKLIENLFRAGYIKTLFSTSTIMEGVNFPADNMFIASEKRGTSNLNSIDFWNLAGRSGRLGHSLYGNVIILRLEENPTRSDILKICTDKIKDQVPSLIEAEKKKAIRVIVDSLSNDDPYLNESKSHRNYARTYSMILTRDLAENINDSVIVEAAKRNSTPEQLEKIRKFFPKGYTNAFPNLSKDQLIGLGIFIGKGARYPEIKDAKPSERYNLILSFLEQLKEALLWGTYEKDTLGKGNSVKWYAVLLNQWFSGYSISMIIKSKIEYDMAGISKSRSSYSSDEAFKEAISENVAAENRIISRTLEDINDVLLFKMLDYFHAFSVVYQEHHKEEIDFATRDWARFTEYGTINSHVIALQSVGFSRDTANLLNKGNYDISFKLDGSVILGMSLLSASEESIRTEAKEIFINRRQVFKQ